MRPILIIEGITNAETARRIQKLNLSQEYGTIRNVFAIDWQQFNDCLSIDFHDGGIWVYINRSNRFTNGGVTVPLGFWELETIGI